MNEEQRTELSVIGQHTLSLIMKRFGQRPFQEEQLLRAGEDSYSGSEYRLALLELRSKKLLITVRTNWGEKYHSIPAKVFETWYERLFAEIPVAWGDDEMVMVSCSQPYLPLGLQLLHGLAELTRTGSRLTTKHLLTKRTIEKCSKQLAFTAETLSILALTPSNGPVSYPLPLSFMLDIAARLQWLYVQEGYIRLNHVAFSSWLALPPDRREQPLMAIIAGTYASRTQEGAPIAALLGRLIPLQWYRVSQLTQTSGQAAMASWCRLMIELGWMEEAQSPQGEVLVRWLIPTWSAEVEMEVSYAIDEAVRITPDGELYVPPTATGRLRWFLELVAERIQSDVMTVYRLTAKSVSIAQQLGIGSHTLVTWLERVSDEPLSVMLRDALDSWGNRSDSGKEGQGKLLTKTGNTDNTDKIDNAFPLWLGDVRQRQHQQDTAGLEGDYADYFASRGIITNELAPLFPDPEALADHDPVTDIPAAESLFQGLDAVPLTWRLRLRDYHVSTRKLLVEQAIAWRIPIQFMQQGELTVYIPEKLENGGGNWQVWGRLKVDGVMERTKLSLDMWNEMRLDVPLDRHT